MSKFKITAILGLLIISLFPLWQVKAATNPYTEAGPYGTNCTWYAWQMAYEKAGVVLPGWGNAKNWYNDASSSGYRVGTTPQANSIIVWGGWTDYGHVGYVERVEDNILYVWDSTGPCIGEDSLEYQECIANSVNEDTDRACRANAPKAACEYTIDPDYYGITGYIYLDYTPVVNEPVSPPSTNDNEDTTLVVEETKSSNNNLSNILVSDGEIEFKSDVYKYDVNVSNKIAKITIEATPEDATASILGTGDYELKVGLNEIKLVVTAEDGSEKEYIINVKREEKTEEVVIDNSVVNDNEYIIILSIGICIILILVIILILKKRRRNNK